jgi:hypothetical protein
MNGTLLYRLFEYIAVIFETLIIHQYAEGFSQNHYSNRRTILVYTIFGSGLMIINIFWPRPLALVTYCGIGILAIEFYLYKSSVLAKLFVALLLVAIVIVSEIISAGIITLIAGIDFIVVVGCGMPRVVSIVVSKLALLIIVKLTRTIAKASRNKSPLLDVKQALPLLLCQIFSITLAYYVFVLGIETQGDFTVTIFFSMLGILYMNFILFWYFEGIKAAFDPRIRSEAAESKLRLQTQYYTLVEEHQKETIALRHDMRRHIAAIKSLMHASRDEISAQYISELEKQVERQAPVIQTPHPLISALLTDEKRKALELGIDFKANVNLVAEIKVSPADLCVMLGNVFDNAIEACAGLPAQAEKYVVVEIMQRESKLLVSVENPYSGKLKTHRGANRGFGLRNVEKVVNGYGGIMDKKPENGIYKIRIIIP